jgi:hypothetical protein
MAKVRNHFSSPSRVLERRKEALARLRKATTPLEKDKRVKKHPRTQEALDAERARLTDLIAGSGKKEKVIKAWNVNDLDRAR